MVNVLEASLSCSGVAVGGAAQAEQPSQRVRLVAGPEQASAPQLGDQTLRELGQVVRQRGRAQPEAGQPGSLPLLQQVGQADGGAGEDVSVAVVFGAGPLVQALPAGDGGGFGLVEEDHQVTEDVHGLPRAGLLWAGLLGPDLRYDL